MNTNVPSVTLQTAVLMQVKEFASTQQPFSVHDVTRAVRSKTSQGELEIPEVEVAGASFRFDIPHAKVKSIFDELWRTGVFDPLFTLNRNFNGTYFEYTPQIDGNVSATPAPVPTYAVIPSAPATNRVDKQTVTAKVKTYLDNHSGTTVTIEQIRAGIKCNGWTCSEIVDIIRNASLPVTITTTNQFVSKVEVSIP